LFKSQGSQNINYWDLDGDSIPNYYDVDSDGDGIPDRLEGYTDYDGDKIPNFVDTDSNGNSVSDTTETGISFKYPSDIDGDGVYDFADLDTDGDMIPDTLDKDRYTKCDSKEFYAADAMDFFAAYTPYVSDNNTYNLTECNNTR